MNCYRPVDRHVLHGQLLGFRELCEAAIPADSRYIVFDLDRTLHLARNMGEYMGWELGAYHSYGPEHLAQVESHRDTSRFLLSRNRPIASSRYIMRGARAWAYPGLHYLLWGRMAERFESSRQLRNRIFGAEPFTTIQSMPTLALLHELGGVPVDMAAELATRLLHRFAGDQVFDKADIAWLQARCPDARLILSSASPRPTVEAAANLLGFEDWLCAEIEIHDKRYSSPYQISPLFLHDEEPQRLSSPSHYRLNAGRAKIRRLLERFPEMAHPEHEVIGMSDTWHGEDHCWTEHFDRVIDVNSTNPFPPLVIADSPLQEIHSAQLLTRLEREHRDDGEPDYVDPRRGERLPKPDSGDHDSESIAATLTELVADVEGLGLQRRALAFAAADETAEYRRELSATLATIEEAVDAYNDAQPGSRRRHRNRIHQLLRAQKSLLRRRTRSERAISEIALACTHKLADARSAIAG